MSEDGSEDGGGSTYERPPSSLKSVLQRAGDQIRSFQSEIAQINAEISRIRAEKEELQKVLNHALEDTKDYALQNALKTYNSACESLTFQRIENKKMTHQIELLKDDRKRLMALVSSERQRMEELQKRLSDLMAR